MTISDIQALVLGLVQGLTEFIPISSTAHLRIVPALMGWNDPGTAFSAVIQLGTLVAVFVYFAGDIRRLTMAALRSLVSAQARKTPDARLAWGIAAGNLPIVLLGLSFKQTIETELRSLYLMAFMLAVVALWLAVVEWRLKHPTGDKPRHKPADKSPGGDLTGLSLRTILIIGCFQALALLPGASRSGSTLLGGLLMGMHRADAARFSFLLGIPAIFGSGLLELPLVLDAVGRGALSWGALLGGLLAAGLSGYASIAFLLAYLRTRTTLLFVVYRLGLALLVAALAWQGLIR